MTEESVDIVDLEDAAYPAAEWVKCPYPLFGALRKRDPVYRVPSRGEYLISRYEEAVFVLRHPELFTSRVDAILRASGTAPMGGYPMVRTDGEVHKVRRRFSSHAFTSAKVDGYRPMIQHHIDELIDRFIWRGEVEFVSEFAMSLPIHVVSEIMDLPVARYDEFAEWGRLEGTATIYQSSERREEQAERSAEMAAWAKQTVLERQESRGDDLISQVITNQIATDGEFDLASCVAETMMLLAAGLFTTTHLLGNAMHLLLSHPEEMHRVRNDPRLIAPLLEEALRIESPVQSVPRIATQDVELAGVTIPVGSTVVVIVGAANRDEHRFQCPAHFDIDRPQIKQHLAFGSGVHTCMGAPLARLEAQMSFASLLERLRDIRLAEGRNDFRACDSMLFRALEQLHLDFTPIGGAESSPADADDRAARA
jgi:cytochrome P450